MSPESVLYEIQVTKLDQKLIGDVPGIVYRPVRVPEHAHGEPVTLVAAVTLPAIVVFAGYLLRKHKGESFDIQVEDVRPDGTRRTKRVRWRKYDSAGAKLDLAGQVKKLAELLAGSGE